MVHHVAFFSSESLHVQDIEDLVTYSEITIIISFSGNWFIQSKLLLHSGILIDDDHFAVQNSWMGCNVLSDDVRHFAINMSEIISISTEISYLIRSKMDLHTLTIKFCFYQKFFTIQQFLNIVWGTFCRQHRLYGVEQSQHILQWVVSVLKLLTNLPQWWSCVIIIHSIGMVELKHFILLQTNLQVLQNHPNDPRNFLSSTSLYHFGYDGNLHLTILSLNQLIQQGINFSDSYWRYFRTEAINHWFHHQGKVSHRSTMRLQTSLLVIGHSLIFRLWKTQGIVEQSGDCLLLQFIDSSLPIVEWQDQSQQGISILRWSILLQCVIIEEQLGYFSFLLASDGTHLLKESTQHRKLHLQIRWLYYRFYGDVCWLLLLLIHFTF